MEERLRVLVGQGLSIREIASDIGKSYTATRWWLAKYKIRTTYPGLSICRFCGENDPVNFYGHTKSRCKTCVNVEDAEIGRAKKLRAIAHMGGQCKRCGYSRYYGALEFHHADGTKDSDWTKLRNYGWARIVEELKKCILVCANCHREIHDELYRN